MKNIKKVYDKGVVSVQDFDLEIRDKEFLVLVGPSGCGKSTTLRMIAGLEDITEGDLYIGDRRINDVSPKDRDIAMVFQNYALYPHMNVYDNMAFSLKLRKLKKDEIKRRVDNAAEILGLQDYLTRKPKALSGGQRQRVALGRAIVRDAEVFLMDEPLSNLDAKLRVQMRAEIQKLHRRLQTTTVYVTHDQTEAMTMATRLVVMKDGFIQQVGSPKEVYELPNNVFVGGFIGSPSMNFFDGKVEGNRFVMGDVSVLIPEGKLRLLRELDYDGKDIILGIRPEDIHDEPLFIDTTPDTVIEASIDVAELMGAEIVLYSTVSGQDFIAKVDARYNMEAGQTAVLAFDMNKAHFFDVDTQLRVRSEKVKETETETIVATTK